MDPASSLRPEWGKWCQALLAGAGFEIKFWDTAAAEALLQEVCMAAHAPTWHAQIVLPRPPVSCCPLHLPPPSSSTMRGSCPRGTATMRRYCAAMPSATSYCTATAACT